MSGVLFYGLLGVGPGAMIGLLALGLVLVSRGTGVLNLAHTSQAALGAYVYYAVAQSSLPLAVALALAILAAGLSGVLIQVLVMLRLGTASPLTKIIASTGVLVVIQASLLLVFGSESRNVPSLLPDRPVPLWDDRAIGLDRLLLLVIAVAVTALLWFVYRFTNFGVRTSSVAENPRVAATLGIDASRIAMANWFLGGALAGLAGALLAPISGLNLITFTSLLVPVLAAALGGGLNSFPLTVLAGLVVGVAQAVASARVEIDGSSTIVTFALLVTLMVLRGKAIPQRGFTGSRMPALGTGRIRPWAVLAGVAGPLVVIWGVASPQWNQAILTSLLIALPMLSVVVITGYAGQLSLAQFSLAGVGAFAAVTIVTNVPGLPFLALLLVGGLAAVPFGWILALAARRMRGASLAILTVGFNVLLFETLFNKTTIVAIEAPTVFGIDLGSLVDPKPYLTFAVLVTALFCLGIANLRRSRSGRRMIAVRGNERAAASLGISVNGTKGVAFMLAAFIAAVGGVLLEFRSTVATFTSFGVLESVNQLGWAVIGGVGFVTGPLIGTGFVPGGVYNQLIATVYNDQFSWLPLLGGVLLLLTILANPDGVAAVASHVVGRFRRRPALARTIPPAPETPAAARAGTRLELDRVSVSFGAVDVLREVSLTVEPGTVHGLIGPNGAGKTTLIDVVSGFVHPRSGQVRLGGRAIDSVPTWRRARLGMGRSFQSLELFDDLTVYDNIRLASEVRERANIVRDVILPRDAELPAPAWDAIRLLDLGDDLDRPIGELTNGKRHLVAIARALAMGADLILLDEPAAGLDDVETAEMRTLIRRLVTQYGVAVLLIEHDVDLVMAVSDTVTALNFGSVVAAGPPAEVRRHPDVVASYLGEEAHAEPVPEEVR